jgi:Cu/Ag efflux protein CusF
MRSYQWFGPVALGLVLLPAGCQKPADSAPKATEKLYEVKGKVVSVNAEKRTVTLDHEDIPGLMKGMRMEFAVEDPKLLTGLAAGDAVQGKLKVRSGDYVLTELAKR